MNVRALVITPDETATVEIIKGLTDLQQHAAGGGYVEGRAASYGGKSIMIYCDEDGKRKVSRPNLAACELGWNLGALDVRDYYAGNVVITGLHMASGEGVDAPEELINLFVGAPDFTMSPTRFAYAYLPAVRDVLDTGSSWARGRDDVPAELTRALDALDAAYEEVHKISLQHRPFAPEKNRDDPDHCSQCGQPFNTSACGPTHATIAAVRRGTES